MMTCGEDAMFVWSVEREGKAFVYGWTGGECVLQPEETGSKRVRRILAVDANATIRLFRDLNEKVSRVCRCRGREGGKSERKRGLRDVCRLTGLSAEFASVRSSDHATTSTDHDTYANLQRANTLSLHVNISPLSWVTIMDAIFAQMLLAN